jgi:hypothetical protein
MHSKAMQHLVDGQASASLCAPIYQNIPMPEKDTLIVEPTVTFQFGLLSTHFPECFAAFIHLFSIWGLSGGSLH